MRTLCTLVPTFTIGLTLVAGLAAATTPAPPPSYGSPNSIRVERPADTVRATFEVHALLDGPRKDAIEVVDRDGTPLYLDPHVVVDARDITAAGAELDMDLTHYDVLLHFGNDGGRRLHAATAEGGAGLRIAILVDGELFAAPYVTAPLDSTAMIANRDSKEDAIALARRLAP